MQASIMQLMALGFQNATVGMLYYLTNYFMYVLVLVFTVVLIIFEFRDKMFKMINDERKVV